MRQVGFTLLSWELREMIIAQSELGPFLGLRQAAYPWECRLPKIKIKVNFSISKTFLRLWRDLAGIVREVWGSTRGTPMPCLWFLEFVERRVLRCYRMVVLGWTPLSQKPIPRPDAQQKRTCKALVVLWIFTFTLLSESSLLAACYAESGPTQQKTYRIAIQEIGDHVSLEGAK